MGGGEASLVACVADVDAVDCFCAIGEAAICYAEADTWEYLLEPWIVLIGILKYLTSICACDGDDLALELHRLDRL